jgi:hypothetical protein
VPAKYDPAANNPIATYSQPMAFSGRRDAITAPTVGNSANPTSRR